MPEHVEETHREDEEKENYGGKENGDCSPPLSQNSLLPELNLIIIVLSLFSLPSTEEGLSFEERNKRSAKDHEAKTYLPRLQTQRPEINECKGRGSPRFQTTIRDSRHCRRM